MVVLLSFAHLLPQASCYLPTAAPAGTYPCSSPSTDVLTTALLPSHSPRPVPTTKPQVLYDFSALFIGQELWVNARLVRVRSIYRPVNKPRWQHVVEADDVENGQKVQLVTGMVVQMAIPGPITTSRYWFKYQGNEVWVVYSYRHGQVIRYQGGSFRQLDSRASAPIPVIPRGAIEVAGAFAPLMQDLLGMSNDQKYLAGEEMGPEFHARHESLAREINEIAAKSFWHFQQ